MMTSSIWQQAHPLEFIGLQMKVTISCGIEIPVYITDFYYADINSGLVGPLWFGALKILLCNAATRQVYVQIARSR